MSKDEVLRGLRMIVVESGKKKAEQSQEYDYNRIRSLFKRGEDDGDE